MNEKDPPIFWNVGAGYSDEKRRLLTLLEELHALTGQEYSLAFRLLSGEYCYQQDLYLAKPKVPNPA